MLHINTTANVENMNAMPLQIKNLQITKKGTTLINNFTLTINSNEVTVILGPNGAGKSLLLRSAHGLETPTKGNLQWNSYSPQPQDSWRAYIFQKPVLLRRSVRANLDYVLSLHNIKKDKHNSLINSALEDTGLSQLADRQARVLSGGEQQRLNIARAWVLKPKVILLDEPTAELDPSGTAAIEHLIETIADQGTKIIMSTHDLGQAHRLANDIVFLHQGKLVEYTPSNEFFEKPQTQIAQDFMAGKLLNVE